MSKLVDFFSGNNTPKYSVRKERVPAEEKEEEKAENGKTSVPYAEAKRNGLYTGNMKNDATAESEEQAGEGTVLADNDESYKSPYETGEVKPTESKSDANEVTDEQETENGKAEVDYPNMRAVIDLLRSKGDEIASEMSDEDKKKFEKAAKRKMLLAGIGDFGHTIHKAYWAARGEKNPHGEQEKPSDKAKKEIRDDWEWMNKKNDRALNYYARAAELEKTIETLKNKEALMEWRTARLQSDIDKATDKSELEWKKLEIDEAYKNGLLTIKQYELLDKQVRTKIAQQNADTAQAREQRMSQGTETIEETTDELGDKKVVHKTNKPLGSQSAGSTSNGGKKPLPTAKKQLP